MTTSSLMEAVAPPPPTCEPVVVDFDFEKKVFKQATLADIKGAMEAGRFCWLDVDVANVEDARRVLSGQGLFADEILEDALTREPATQIARYDDYIHMVMSGCRLVGDMFTLERVDVVIGENFMVTLHKGAPIFLEAVKRAYPADFKRFARSPSFLIYELWDHLIDNYLAVQKKFEDRVEKTQAALIGDVDDRVFQRVSELGADLLHFRKVVLPARSVLTDLSSRKSIFVSEATQPFLANMVGNIERVLQDLLVERDILSGSLDLYMSMVGHKTNRVMNRLTVLSVIFLPLTFLSGIWGMNFEGMWGLNHSWLLLFWLPCGIILGAVGMFLLLRHFKVI
jgi:magnesium transporter